MTRKYNCALVFLTVHASFPLAAADPFWKAGPARMNLGGRAVIQVPQGGFYHDGPFAPQLKNAPGARASNVVQLGSLRRGLLTVSFSYITNPYPLTDHLAMRTEAFLVWNTVADRTVRNLSVPPLAGSRRFTGKVFENDRFDWQTASLKFSVGVVPVTRNPGGLVVRRRATVFFARHGTLVSEFGLPELLFKSAERDYDTLLQQFSFVPGEGPAPLDRIPLASSTDTRQLALYALCGLLTGLALALFRCRGRSRFGPEIRHAQYLSL